MPGLWSPKRSENNQQPGSCQPRGKNNQLYLEILPMAPWPGLFVHYKALCSFREQCLAAQNLGASILGKANKVNGMIQGSLMKK
jgi:hypothetical protein